MFNFMKKGQTVSDDHEEKERKKLEKKMRKDNKSEGTSTNMTTEELLRLDEVRKSLRIRSHRKVKKRLPSGITADYSASFFAHLDAVPEQDRGNEEVVALANTTTYIDNNGEMIICSNIPQSDSSENSATVKQTTAFSNNYLNIATSPSPSAGSFTDTSNSSFATPTVSMSPVGELQTLYRWSQSFEETLPLPPINIAKLPPVRDLVIKRQKTPRNDFGFSLRKAMVLCPTNSLLSPKFQSVIFAEPSMNIKSSTGLLPGDRLLKVNGLSVEDMPRETIIDMIKNSSDSVSVQVQPVAELVELSRRCINSSIRVNSTEMIECNTLKGSANQRINITTIVPDQIYNNIENTKIGRRVWVVHQGGFTAASMISSDAGKTLVQLEHSGEELHIDDEDIENANPEKLDLVEDICQLVHLNESSVLHVLRQRFANNIIHTRAGPVLIVLNPSAPLSLYSEKIVSMFRGCKTEDMPPHIFSHTQTAYREMLESRRDQSLIFMGRSGSGKTTNFKHALYYLALAAGSNNKILSVQRVSAINIILEAFGNAQTYLNNNATKCTQIVSLDFDYCGQIISASIQILLLDRLKLRRHIDSEQYTFHIFTSLLLGAEGHLQKELYLESSSLQSNIFIKFPKKLEDRQKALLDFAKIQQAFNVLGMESSLVKAFWCVLAAIFHLGNASCEIKGTVPTLRAQFAEPTHARTAALLLGVSMEELSAIVFPITVTENASDPSDALGSAFDCLEGLVIGLYTETVSAIVAYLNKTLSTTSNAINSSILLVDTPGFYNPCGFQSGATLSNLKHNYLQERLQLLFHHVLLNTPRNRYAQELVEIESEPINETCSVPLINLLDKTPQSHVVCTSQNNLRDSDKRGLLWMLDEEIMYPNSSDETFLNRLFSSYSDRENQMVLKRGPGELQFTLQHMEGTNPVTYNALGWLRESHEHSSTKDASSLLRSSIKPDVSSLTTVCFRRAGGTNCFSSVVGAEGNQSMRRVSSIRRSFASNGIKRSSLMMQVKFTVDGIIDALKRTGTHFTYCFMLHNNAGPSEYLNANAKGIRNEDIQNISLLKSQLRGSQILHSSRLYRFGFPISVPLAEFINRFTLLSDASKVGEATVQSILHSTEIDSSVYRIGSSQDVAVQCIQRNVRAFLKVREWPWWRLFVKVSPLLNILRTEEQLKIATNDLLMMKKKLEKIESERNKLKIDNEKLDLRLSEVTSELTEEHSTSNLISERLEAETKERMKLQKDVEQQHMKYKSLQESSEKMEMELLCAKSDLSGDLDDVLENDVGVNVYKVKYERAMRELEFTKKRLQTQHEHDLEQLVGLKKQLEKKLANAYEEVEEQRQVVSDWKRKAQKMTNEMNDLRMLLDEQSSRNNLLEKRHRKFDSETQALQDTIRQEKQMREKLAREKDFLFAEKSTLEQTLSDVRLELELKEEKYSVLQQELAEMTFDGVTEEEIGLLKRQKMELVRRCKEQEEELDEMAAQIQMLEQVKLRLEMSLETFRKQTRKEAQQREDEVEETRSNCYKKIKSLECQLEQEHEERTLMMREKHELERRLRTLEENDRIEQATEESTIQKLKRELRKTKALLRDTQSQLDRIKSESVVKTQLRHLRNQLEDAEMARCAALKARKIAENELQDVQLILEETQRARVDAHEKANTALRERSDLQAQIDENEEEMAELMKKYSATIKQLSCDQDIISEYEIRITELESEKKSLKENILELTSRLATVESLGESSSNIIGKRFELRNKELESRLEFEQATRMRIEIQLNRQKESFEKALNEMSQIRSKEISVQEALKKSQKIVRELREEVSILTSKEQENISQRKSLEKQVESLESECNSTRADLRLALQRISDLQQAMEEDGSYHSESDVESTTDSENVFSIHSPINDMLYPKESGNLDYSSNDKNSGIYTRETEENFARSPSLPTQAIT
ncbi:unconventional myosin-XVIIIa isoform X2 [Armigeres subalbatus]|uniref:unconventional myosin-XVIIIa isoform X2 n=1 Tax=Armigeres subalbatus TaxID=124917 RepID=UPI002ED4CA1F